MLSAVDMNGDNGTNVPVITLCGLSNLTNSKWTKIGLIILNSCFM